MSGTSAIQENYNEDKRYRVTTNKSSTSDENIETMIKIFGKHRV